MNTTLITGASSGIGEVFARKLAARGRNVLLVARSEDKLITLCNELGRSNSIRAQYVALDLSKPESPARLFEEDEEARLDDRHADQQRRVWFDGRVWQTRSRARAEHDRSEHQVAGGTDASFSAADASNANRARSSTSLRPRRFKPCRSWQLTPPRKRSCFRFQKRFWEENRPHGIKVMALCPGVTETNFFEAARGEKPPARVSQTPEEVVDTALRGLARGKSHIISGWTNFLMTEAERLVPRSLVTRVAGRMMRGRNRRIGTSNRES